MLLLYWKAKRCVGMGHEKIKNFAKNCDAAMRFSKNCLWAVPVTASRPSAPTPRPQAESLRQTTYPPDCARTFYLGRFGRFGLTFSGWRRAPIQPPNGRPALGHLGHGFQSPFLILVLVAQNAQRHPGETSWARGEG